MSKKPKINPKEVILLHPKVAKLVQEMVRQTGAGQHEIVNEILWLALREGDIAKHYTEICSN